MTDAGYVIAGYVVTGAVLAAYTARLLWRGRSAAKALPPEERRWR
jgi:hypothetical protein